MSILKLICNLINHGNSIHYILDFQLNILDLVFYCQLFLYSMILSKEKQIFCIIRLDNFLLVGYAAYLNIIMYNVNAFIMVWPFEVLKTFMQTNTGTGTLV